MCVCLCSSVSVYEKMSGRLLQCTNSTHTYTHTQILYFNPLHLPWPQQPLESHRFSCTECWKNKKQNSTYSRAAVTVDALTKTGCINGFLLLQRVCSLIRRPLNYHTVSKCVCCLISTVKGRWGTNSAGGSGAFNTLMLLMGKRCLCICVCVLVQVGKCGHAYAKKWRCTVCTGEIMYTCMCVVLHFLAQCSRPTIIRAASHTDLVA